MASKSDELMSENRIEPPDAPTSLSGVKRRRLNSEEALPRLLVCDLNGVLVLKKSNSSTTVRPNAAEFLRTMSKYYTLGIWSSGRRKTVKSIMKKVLPQDDVQFLFVWSQEKCELINGFLHKHLKKVWDTFPAFNASNTVMTFTFIWVST